MPSGSIRIESPVVMGFLHSPFTIVPRLTIAVVIPASRTPPPDRLRKKSNTATVGAVVDRAYNAFCRIQDIFPQPPNLGGGCLQVTRFSRLVMVSSNECVEFSNFHRWDCINVSSHGIRSLLGPAV